MTRLNDRRASIHPGRRGTTIPTITKVEDSAYRHHMYEIAVDGTAIGYVEGPIERKFWRVQTTDRSVIHRYAYSRREAIEYLVSDALTDLRSSLRASVEADR